MITTVIVTIAAIITSAIIFLLLVEKIWEIVAEIKGALCVPIWLDNLYYFFYR